MRLSLPHIGTAVLFILLALTFSCNAKADTYSFQVIGSSSMGTFVGGDDYGDWTVRLYSFYSDAHCGTSAAACYETYSALSKQITYSQLLPSLAIDPMPTAGSGCTVSAASIPGAQAFCNNGHEALGNIDGVWTVSNSVATLAYRGAPANGIMLSPSGNLFYTDGYHENLIAALDLTTLPAAVALPTGSAPEPGSLWLLATGALGVVGAARRRLLQIA